MRFEKDRITSACTRSPKNPAPGDAFVKICFRELTFSRIHLPVFTFFDGLKVNIVFESLKTT